MLTHPKISPIIPHTITLSSPYNHQDFIRKNPKFPFNLYLNSILEDQPGQFDPKVREQKDLSRIFRSLKCIRKIQQDDLVFYKTRLPASKAKYLIKKTQRVEVLDLQDMLPGAKITPARLDLWLKYAKNLKSINYQFAMQIFGLKASIRRFEREIQLCLRLLPQHRNLTTFKIRLPVSSSNTIESLLEFQRYPSSLKTFAIYQQTGSDPRLLNTDVVASGFSRLKSLKSLTLSGVNLLNVTQILLEKTPSLLNVKKFNVQHAEIHAFGPLFDLNKCQTFQNLQHLKIGNIAEMNPLSLSTSPPQLESLDIAAGIGVYGLGLISQFISIFSKSLKSLKMDIHYPYEIETEEKMKNLFSKASELEKLTSFKFKVKNTAPPFGLQKVSLSPEIIENLKGLFLKPVKLESFEWEVPRVSNPGVFLALLKLLEGSCLILRKLKISHPFIDLEKSQETWLFSFLRRLERIKVLYLTGFEIKEKHLWIDFVDSFLKMKTLRALKIGNVTEGFQEEWFTKPMMKIAQIKGLEVLEVGSSFRQEMEEVVGKPLDLKEIMRLNPALRKISQNVRVLFNTVGLEEHLF